MPAHGTLDRVTADAIDGWAFDPADPDKPVAITILDGDVKIASLLADRYRPDLEKAGYGNGRHAFHLSLPKGFFGLPAQRIRVVIEETGRDLRRSPAWLRLEKTDAVEAHERWLQRVLADSIAGAESVQALEPFAQLFVNGIDAVMRRADHLGRLEASRPVGETLGLIARSKLPEHLAGLTSQLIERHAALHVPQGEAVQFSIIIAATGSYADLMQCLKAVLHKAPAIDSEVIVVDISGQTEMLLAPLLLSGAVRVLRLGRQSLAEAYRLGKGIARGPACLFMDSAVAVAPGCIGMLRATLDDAGGRAIIAPRLLGSEGRLLEAGRQIGPAAMRSPVGYRASPGSLPYRLLRETDEVPAEIFLAPAALLDELDAFAEAGPLGDWCITDLCLKARSQAVPVLMQGAADAALAADLPLTRSGPPAVQRSMAERWSDVLAVAAEKARPRPKAMVIDARFPEPDQDAGSEAVFSHALSLKRLGFDVAFLAHEAQAKRKEEREGAGFLTLLRHGILPLAPADAAAELAAQSGELKVIYLHRAETAEAVLPACKAHHPEARLLYCPADLRHLRLEREAELLGDDALKQAALAALNTERAIMAKVDAVLVHSRHEQELCRTEALHRSTRLVPWTIRMKPTPRPFEERRDIGFIGGYRHRPNCDAAIWFATTVLPRLRESEPQLQFYLAGSHMPPDVAALGLQPGVRVLGYVADLSRLLGGLRLTVAPLRFGAGLKGKVLTSLAAGVPCIMTKTAAEGFDLPAPLDSLLCNEDRIHEAILAALADAGRWAALREAGLRFVAEGYAEKAVDAALAPLLLDDRLPLNHNEDPLRAKALRR